MVIKANKAECILCTFPLHFDKARLQIQLKMIVEYFCDSPCNTVKVVPASMSKHHPQTRAIVKKAQNLIKRCLFQSGLYILSILVFLYCLYTGYDKVFTERGRKDKHTISGYTKTKRFLIANLERKNGCPKMYIAALTHYHVYCCHGVQHQRQHTSTPYAY